jgi:hypothetical protein
MPCSRFTGGFQPSVSRREESISCAVPSGRIVPRNFAGADGALHQFGESRIETSPP